MTDYVVEARGLEKRFGDILAVQGVDLLVPKGSVFGALGPNGSGKSTTVRMLLGLSRPDKGDVRLFGERLRDHGPDLLQRVGAVVETPAFVPYLSGRDNLRLLDKYTPGAGAAGIEAALQRVHLEHAAHRRFKNYSLGMKQRLGIAAAILHDPDLIVLDEPTNGLDPQGTREVRALIPELAHEGRTVILASHLLHEVEQVCDAVGIFQRGTIRAQGLKDDLLRGRSQLEIHVSDSERAEAILRATQWGQALERRNGAVYLRGAEGAGEQVNRLLAGEGLYASSLGVRHFSLEDLYFEVTGESTTL